jgi:hypothetical protein
MIVGDSFAAGHGVGEENRFGHLLQAELGDRAKVDVLATSSYSPVIYRNLIRKAFSLAAYRAVAVFIDQTDPADDMIYELDVIKDRSQSFDLERVNDRRQVFEKARADFVEHFSGPLNPRRFAVFNLLFPLSIKDFFDPRGKYYREAKLSFGRLALIAEFNAHPESDNSKTMLSLISGHLDQIVAMSQERRVHLFLIANPWEYQSSKSPRTSLQQPAPLPKRNRLEEILTAKYGHLAGVTVVPLTRFFREQPDPSSLFISHPADETHWNQKGHVLVAAVLRQYLGNSLPDLFPGRNLN